MLDIDNLACLYSAPAGQFPSNLDILASLLNGASLFARLEGLRFGLEMRPDVVFLNFEKVNLWNHKNSLLFFSLFHQSRWANKLSVLEVFVKSSFIEPRACMEYGIKTLVCLTKI
jgi:hypothetical protein